MSSQSSRTSNNRPRKEEVQYKIEHALIKGDISQCEDFRIDYLHDGGERVGTFDKKSFYSAQIIINVYVANILREHARVAVIRRDVQFHYVDNKKQCYQCCINPAPEECFDSEEYEIALVAKSDGEGNFEYFFYDQVIIEEYEKSAKRTKNVQRRDNIHGTIKFLQAFETIYQVTLLDDVYDVVRGVNKQGNNKVDLSAYTDFLLLDQERTEREGKGLVKFYIPKTISYYNDEQDLIRIEEQIERLEQSLKRNRSKRRRILDRLGRKSDEGN